MLSLASMAQDTEIDNVNSDSTAMQFFRKNIIRGSKESNYNDFKLTQGNEWINYYNFSEQQKNELLSKYKYSSWAKTDLNGDKKDDLIISGYLSKVIGKSNHYRLFIFLTQPNNSFEIAISNSNTPQYFRLIDVDTSKYIEISKWSNDLYKQEENLPLRIDTLEFNYPMMTLVDYQKLVSPSSIKKVVYKETYLPRGYAEATVINNQSRNSDFVIKIDAQDGSRPEINNAKISQDLMKDFLDITSRLKKYEILSGNPMTTISDGDVKKSIEVEYDDGTKIFIDDNTGRSSYTLEAIYNWFQYSINNVYEQINNRSMEYNYDPFAW